MKFICKNNMFLANMINMKNLKEVTFSHKVSGKVELFTNYEVLNHLFQNATKNQLIEIQSILKKDNFSIKAINELACNYGKEFFK